MTDPTPEQTALALFDENTPTSFAAKCPAAIVGHLRKAFDELLPCQPYMHDEDALADKLLELHKYRPTPSDNRIRMAIWLEYERSIANGDKMQSINLHSLVCDQSVFYRMLRQSPRCLWFLCKPTKYEEATQEILLHGQRQLRKILDMDVYDEKGKLNTKLLELKLKITAMADFRIHGAPTQKIQQLNMNLTQSVNGDQQQLKDLVARGDMAGIKQRLLEIEMEKRKLEGRSEKEVIDVTDAPKE